MEENQIHGGPDNGGHIPGEKDTDAAGKFLADALRLSYWMLSAFMIGVIVLFFFTGFTKIESGQCGVRRLFGRIQGQGDGRVLRQGLHWSMPKPIGRIIVIPTAERTVEIKDLWFHETAEEALKPLDKRKVRNEGLRPGKDGAVLTGDRSLVHLKILCKYKIGVRKDRLDPQAIIDFVSNTMDDRKAVRLAVCNAAVRVAALSTIESIYPPDKDFTNKVSEYAQRRLDELGSGIKITAIIPVSTVPLAAIPAFKAENRARSERDRRINEARGQADKMLASTAGESWTILAGGLTSQRRTSLLRQYADAREKGDAAAADKLLDRINSVLMSNRTGGSAARIIDHAKSYSTTIRQSTRARAEAFEKLLDSFLAAPELMLNRRWTEEKQKILASPLISKYYITPGKAKTVIYISQDPEIVRSIARETFKAKEEQKKAPR